MLQNYLKTAIRNLLRYKTYSGINILGLSAGLASVLLIGLYVQNELSYDRYHQKSDRIYRLANHIAGVSFENGIAKVSAPWGPAAEAEIPEVEKACRFVFFGQALVEKEGQQYYESNGMFADPSVFEIFSWKLLEGNAGEALLEPNTIVLTRPFAEKYFGEENPVGKALTVNQESEYRITGIVEAPPSNSHFTFDFLASSSSYRHPEQESWLLSNQFYTYLLLRPGADPELVAEKMDGLLAQHLDEETSEAYTPFLQPIASIHLHSKLHREMSANSDRSYIYIFGSIALFILFIACLNFINLATARAVQRAKEVGVRKVSGASRRELILQFLGESMFLTGIAAVISVGMVRLILPRISSFPELNLALNWQENYWLSGGLLGLVLLVGLLSGSYPALVLSSFKPASVLKGRLSPSGSPFFRKVLITSQFAVAVFLIIATMAAGGQLRYIQNKNLGFNKEQILLLPFRSSPSPERVRVFREELGRIPGVVSISASANRPGGSDYGVPYEAVGLPEGQQPAMRCLVVDEAFLDTYQMEVTRGRGFSSEFPADTSAYLINETAAQQLGWDNPVGRQLAMPAIGRAPGPVVGIVRDFHFRSLHDPITPLYFFVQPGWFSQFSLRLETKNLDNTLALIEEKWQSFEPGYPFTYSFFDESFDNLHRAEQRTAALIQWFTVVAILLTCMGLFGLASFMTARRTREIGIRKVMGATASRIFGLLAWNFLALVGIAFAVAVLPAWWAARRWLSNFAFHAELQWWHFLIAGALAMGIALISVSWQSIRAAVANPAEALKYE
ncbi:MAG: ABC transporter permease [Phaeodactylibacter sp.]|nr:ABC transporter permease [Phaeodactylibacter sp.]